MTAPAPGPGRRVGGLRGQMLLLVLGALMAAQAASVLLFLDERGRALLYATAQDTAGRSLTLADALDTADPDQQRRLLRESRSRNLRFDVDATADVQPAEARALAATARRIAGTDPRELRLAVRRDAPGWRDRDRDDDSSASGTLVVSAALDGGGWLNARTRLRRPPPQLAGPVLVSIGLTALALTAAVWIAVGRIVKPMAALAGAAGSLGRGDKPDPLALAGPTEMRAVTLAFNDMADRLTRLIAQQQRTLAAIGHDLRSPITAMRLRLELVDDDETRERLAVCLDEIQALVEAALALARGDGASEPLVATDLAALLVALAEEMQEAGQSVTLTSAAPLTAMVRPAALKRALRNIAENAVRYGGAARLSLTAARDRAVIAVEDDGPGIAPEDRERVFEPFVRLESVALARDRGRGARAGHRACGDRGPWRRRRAARRPRRRHPRHRHPAARLTSVSASGHGAGWINPAPCVTTTVQPLQSDRRQPRLQTVTLARPPADAIRAAGRLSGSLGAPIIRSSARWFIGNMMTSRMFASSASSITIRSMPGGAAAVGRRAVLERLRPCRRSGCAPRPRHSPPSRTP